jgi:hypothetical protein
MARAIRVIEIDATGWSSMREFYPAVSKAVGAPDDIIATSPYELLDFMVWGGFPAVRPPYVLRLTSKAPMLRFVRDEILWIASLIEKVQGGLADVRLELHCPGIVDDEADVPLPSAARSSQLSDAIAAALKRRL